MSDDEIQGRLEKLRNAMNNPCGDGNHNYSYSVIEMGKAKMVQQICNKCFDIMGWLHDWHDPEDDSY
jgi:hypothetical protein